MLLQNELTELDNYFKDIENKSLSIIQVPENQYLCIRIDGFKVTKNFLKDRLVNEEFNNNLNSSFYKFFESFKKYFGRGKHSSIICSFIVNDEVSIILNKNLDNDGNRIMKASTLIASFFGSHMTQSYKDKNIFFDARPLILKENEISQYIRYRFLISKRYAYWKMLRLNKYPNVYEDEIKKNIDNSIQAVEEINKNEDVEKILNTFKFLVTNTKEDPKFSEKPKKNKKYLLNDINSIITNYLNYSNHLDN
ncbi:tRNA(His) guanylyltransferase Thg1 family protein [Aliarcobacter lanthieri]|uniref:tRNA(His) guanylyltransferase Thg1 family protein n=1 Tax=Aliarcobacter lanthieri TaxID=1355374 RepID=UPI003AA90292